jgi:hypothetical protein
MPADLLLDTGHPAGVRMRDRGAFNDPASPKAALLIECGQHWERSAQAVAIDTTLRFLAAVGSVRLRSGRRAPVGAIAGPPARRAGHRAGRGPQSMNFEFLVPIEGLGVVARSRHAHCTRRRRTWVAPYADTVLVMPSLRHLRPGNTQVRLGRYETDDRLLPRLGQQEAA